MAPVKTILATLFAATVVAAVPHAVDSKPDGLYRRTISASRPVAKILQVRYTQHKTSVVTPAPKTTNYGGHSLYTVATDLSNKRVQLGVDTYKLNKNAALYDSGKALYADSRKDLHDAITNFNSDKSEYKTALAQVKSGNPIAALALDREKHDLYLASKQVTYDQTNVKDIQNAVSVQKAKTADSYYQVKADQAAVNRAYVNLKNLQKGQSWRA